MSSLAATQADGYYVPVAYYDSGAYKKKSKNQFQSEQHHDKKSASSPSSSSSSQSSTSRLVRFELPYDGICNNCQSYIKRGTRYNAYKTKVGMYHTTPIYEFHMNCRSCSLTTTATNRNKNVPSSTNATDATAPTGSSNDDGESTASAHDTPTTPASSDRLLPTTPKQHKQEFVIRVDPSSFGFLYVSGIRKHERRFEAHSDDQCIVLDVNDNEHVLSSGAQVLELDKINHKRRLTELEQLQHLQQYNHVYHYQDAQHNSKLRAAFRHQRKKRQSQLNQGAAVGWRNGMAILDNTTVDEDVTAQTTIFGNAQRKEQHQWQQIQSSSIFDNSKKSGANEGTTSASKAQRQSSRKSNSKSFTRNQELESRPENVLSNPLLQQSRERPAKKRSRHQQQVETIDMVNYCSKDTTTSTDTSHYGLTHKTPAKTKRTITLPSIAYQASGKPAALYGTATPTHLTTPRLKPQSALSTLLDYDSSASK